MVAVMSMMSETFMLQEATLILIPVAVYQVMMMLLHMIVMLQLTVSVSANVSAELNMKKAVGLDVMKSCPLVKLVVLWRHQMTAEEKDHATSNTMIRDMPKIHMYLEPLILVVKVGKNGERSD